MRACVAAVFALASACAGDEGFCILRFICFTRWTHGYATYAEPAFKTPMQIKRHMPKIGEMKISIDRVNDMTDCECLHADGARWAQMREQLANKIEANSGPENGMVLSGHPERAVVQGRAPEGVNVDGIHPTAAGSRVLANRILQALD